MVGWQLVHRDQEIRENCSGNRAPPALCYSHGGLWPALVGDRRRRAMSVLPEKILVATDGSEQVARTALRAAELAGKLLEEEAERTGN